MQKGIEMTEQEALMQFVEFNPVKFLKASKKWKDKRKEIKDELDTLSELPAIESSGVQSSNISDLTYNSAIKRIKLDNELKRIEKCIAVRDWALNSLSSFDRELIEGFFYPKNSIYMFVETFKMENALCTSDVYAARREALDAFTELITTKYGL